MNNDMDIGISINIFDNGYGRWKSEKYLKLKEHGFSCVDLNMSSTGTDIYRLPLKDAEALLLREKRLADEAGIRIHQSHGPWRSPIKDYLPEDRAERMDKMKRSIYLSALLDCRYWVIHPIMPFGANEIGSEAASGTWELNIEFMSELLRYAKQNNITICLENVPMSGFSLAKPADVHRVVSAIDDDNFKMCLDTGHVSVFDGLSVGDCIRAYGNDIKVFHVHDNRHGKDLHLFPYFGVIDWADVGNAIKEIGFKGVFSLETAPSEKLNDELFGEMCISLRKIAQQVIR